MIVLDSIWPDIGEKVRIFGKLKMFSSLVWLVGFITHEPLQAI